MGIVNDMLGRSILLGLFGICACSQTGPLDGLQAGESGRVVRVIDGDALVLDTGQSVRLIGIEAPAGPYKERQAEPFYEDSRRMLEDLSLGREVELRYAGLTRDRYDRALAHVITKDKLGPDFWLNAEMAKRGGARVRVYPDTAMANEDLLEAEDSARLSMLGLWKLSEYQTHLASDLPEDLSRFQIIEGELLERTFSEASNEACRFRLLDSPLIIKVQRGAAELCQSSSGDRVRARGWIQDGELSITHPLNMKNISRQG